MHSITPFITQDKAPGELQNAIVELMQLDAALNASIPASLRYPLTYLLRFVNSFYSNKIEGNPTLPADILHRQESPASEPDNSNLMEIKRHVEVQTSIAGHFIPKSNISSPEFLKHIHKSFYEVFSEKNLITCNPDTGEEIKITPGKFRNRSVKVGTHVPPLYNEVDDYIQWFSRAYNPEKIFFGLTPILAAAAAHHRLMWIHPFMDGNGRVGRLFTDSYMRCAGFGGYGIWSMSRGFGRNTGAYYSALAKADCPRKGDQDGRGILSDDGLLEFTRYFVEVALDQAKYFTSLLEPRKLNERIDIYFEMRSRGELTSVDGKPLRPLRSEARNIYKKLLHTGPQQKREIASMLGVNESTTRKIIKQMEADGLVDAPVKQPVTLQLSPHSIEMLFPHLW
jgi:Fic family protein